MRIGFLHTAAVHVETFEGLVEDRAPGAEIGHVVDETLLANARARGQVDPELRRRIVSRLLEAADGADVVVCTCSTISGAAEDLRSMIGIPVVRVDRPMAERAAIAGNRIAVVAAVESTVGPTVALLEGVAASMGQALQIETSLVPGAWDMFEAGDLGGYHTAVASTVTLIRGQVDAVVLAQASMAPVAAWFAGGPPVLSSPALAVDAAIALASRRAAGQTSEQ